MSSMGSVKPETCWEDFYWEGLRAEHARNRCEECREGGCLMSNMGLNMNIEELRKHTDNIEEMLKQTKESFKLNHSSAVRDAATIFIPMIEDQLAISKNILKILEKNNG